MGRKSLDNILGEDQDTTAEIRQQSPDEVEPKGVAEAEEPAPAETEADAPQEETPSEVPPTSDKLPENVYKPLKAVRDENKELKALIEQQNTRYEQLRQEIEAKKEPAAPPPDMFESPEGWQQHFGGHVVSQAVQEATFKAKLNQSEFYARKNVDGFEDAWGDLNDWLEKNPSVAQQAAADIDPWGFAYRQFNNQRQLAEVGDVDALKAKMREEIMAEIQAQQPPAVPPSLSTQRSVSSRTGPAWAGPKSLGDLLS